MKFYCDVCHKVFPVDRAGEQSNFVCPECGKEIPLPESEVGAGVVLGDFLIEKEIARGGMGIVYLARQLSLERHVALKVLQNCHTDDKEYVESLFREARAAAKINHPNVVQAYAIGEEDGVFYFAMEYIRGETFKTILKEKGGKLDFKTAAQVIRDVARALAAAWKEQKLVHQDIKPDNIMFDANGFAKLADLGLAKNASTVQDENDESNEVLGTPQYISPEQLTGVPTDVRSDIYSLGATFYQFVTGRYAYVANSLDELPRMHIEGNLEPPKNVNPELPDALNNIIIKMMARKPENRYQLPEELVQDLEAYLVSLTTTQGIKPQLKLGAPATAGKQVAVPQLKFGSAGLKPGVPPPAKVNKTPLTLNLGGAKAASAAAKPAVPPAAPAAAKPAVPPAAPAAAKPAVPPAAPAAAKPAVPPAAPAAAKPAVPPAAPAAAKPAVPPAAPAAAKPVVPAAKPVTPAAVPVAKKAETKPVKEVEVKPADSTPAVKLAPVVAKPATDKKAKTKSRNDNATENTGSKIGAIIGKILLLLLVLVILAVAFCVTVIVLDRKEKLPAMLAPVANFLNKKAVAAKEKAIELSKPQNVVVETVPQGPVTRPEYIKKTEELLDFRRFNSQKRSEFLAMVDTDYEYLCGAVTEEEKKAFERLMRVFSSTDEQFRCINERKTMRSAYMHALNQAVTKRVKAEERRLAEIERQKLLDKAAAERSKELDERNKQMVIEEQKRLAAVKQECFKYGEQLASAMLTAAINGDRTALDEAQNKAASFIRVAVIQSAEEIKLFNALKFFSKELEKELKNLQLYKKRLSAIDASRDLFITIANKDIVLIEQIVPGAIYGRSIRNNQPRTILLHKVPGGSRLAFKKVMNSRFKMLYNPDFFISLFNRHVDPMAMKDMPEKGFWKTYWMFFAKELQKK